MDTIATWFLIGGGAAASGLLSLAVVRLGSRYLANPAVSEAQRIENEAVEYAIERINSGPLYGFVDRWSDGDAGPGSSGKSTYLFENSKYEPILLVGGYKFSPMSSNNVKALREAIARRVLNDVKEKAA